LLVYLFALTLALTGAWAQSDAGSVSGTITDNSGTPLSGALVTINGTNRETAFPTSDGGYPSRRQRSRRCPHCARLLPGLRQSKDYSLFTSSTGQSRHSSMPRLGDEVVQLDEVHRRGPARRPGPRAQSSNAPPDNLKEHRGSSDALGRFPDQNASETLATLSAAWPSNATRAKAASSPSAASIADPE
jgi:hypothetical protein